MYMQQPRGTLIALWTIAVVMIGVVLFGVTSIVLPQTGHALPWMTSSSQTTTWGNGMMGNGGMMGNRTLPTGIPAIGMDQVLLTDQDTFQPAIIQIPIGTTVTWTNTDSDVHTVSFMPAMISSGELHQHQTFTYTFRSSGTYPYFCRYHANMVGEVIVTSQ
jgi:plastocyanin